MLGFRGSISACGIKDGKAYITLETGRNEIQRLYGMKEQQLNAKSELPFAIEIKKYRRRRSLDANAYFHVLCDKIAKVVGTSMDKVKHDMVLQYGTLHKDMADKYIGLRLPCKVDPKGLGIDYARPINYFQDCTEWAVYKPTHTLNTAEMAQLIEGAIAEAQQLDIDTLTPNERANMLSLWENRK